MLDQTHQLLEEPRGHFYGRSRLRNLREWIDPVGAHVRLGGIKEVATTAQWRKRRPSFAAEESEEIPTEQDVLSATVGEIGPQNGRKPIGWRRGYGVLRDLDDVWRDRLIAANSGRVHHVSHAALRRSDVDSEVDVAHAGILWALVLAISGDAAIRILSTSSS